MDNDNPLLHLRVAVKDRLAKETTFPYGMANITVFTKVALVPDYTLPNRFIHSFHHLK